VDTEKIFRSVFWVLIGLVLLMRVYFAARVWQAGERNLPDRPAVKREGVGPFLARVIGFFLLIGLLLSYAVQPPWIQSMRFPLPSWLRWAAAALGLASLLLWTWTQVELGALWSAQLQLREQHRLVTAGPYSRMRHPLYTAMLLWAASLALVSANWLFVAVAVLTAGVFFIRVPREEQMMIERFGDEYRQFMQRTGRFLPK
jgi:protein-S-isoprenylcysteine O-methyltransferase Ste14